MPLQKGSYLSYQSLSLPGPKVKTKVARPQTFMSCLGQTKSATQSDQKMTRSKGWKKDVDDEKLRGVYTVYSSQLFIQLIWRSRRARWNMKDRVCKSRRRHHHHDVIFVIIIIVMSLSSSSSLRLSPSLCNTERLPKGICKVKPDHKTDWVNNSIGWHQLFKSVPLIDSNYIVSFAPQE